MEFFMNYGLFLAKTLTIVIAMVALFALIMVIAAKAKEQTRLSVCKLNKKFAETASHMNELTQSKENLKLLKKKEKIEKKQKKDKTPKNRIFVLNFIGDLRASAVSNLREEITAILLTAKPEDEVLIRLESPGGVVNGYGLAASQLKRIKDAGIKLIVSIDKVAASGGYMMAAVADHIIAAPFSIVGSVGVVAQMPNFHRFLKKHEIDFEQITAGTYKRTLSLFGENTEEGREKAKEEIHEAYELFKNFIRQNRPSVDVDRIATGEYWFAAKTLELNLIDELKTSDDFLLSRRESHDLYEIHYRIKKPFSKRISTGMNNLLEYLGYAPSTFP